MQCPWRGVSRGADEKAKYSGDWQNEDWLYRQLQDFGDIKNLNNTPVKVLTILKLYGIIGVSPLVGGRGQIRGFGKERG